jgi:hypothetical protein
MERGNSKVGPRLDEELKHETEGLIRGGHGTHAEEWKEAEPSGEDQPIVGLRPEESELEQRAELASYLGRAPYPLVRDEVLQILADRQAPEHVVALAARLTAGVVVENLQDLWRRIGGATE